MIIQKVLDSKLLKPAVFVVALIVIIFTIWVVNRFLLKPEAIAYTEMQPISVITGPPETPLKQPAAVAVGLRGQLYIADTGNKQIMVIEEDGRYSFKFGMPGSGLAEMEKPVGLDVSPNGNVYVADVGKQAVLVFNGDGEYLYTISDTKKGNFIPLSVHSDKQGNVYVFNKVENRFRVYDSKGKRTSQYPTSSIKGPKNVISLFYNWENGQIFVVGSGSSGFYKWKDEKGQILGEDRLVDPQGVTYNRSKGTILISDGYKNKIIVFSEDGKYLGEFGEAGDGMTAFSYPSGLAVDERGKLYIADRDNNRVMVYFYK